MNRKIPCLRLNLYVPIFIPPTMPCSGTLGAVFKPPFLPEVEGTPEEPKRLKVRYNLYQSLGASIKEPGFSFEELRFADYIQMGKLQPEQSADPKVTRAENPTSTTRTSFQENGAMEMEQKAMSTTSASCSKNAVFKKEPADSSSRPATGSKTSEQWSEVETGHYEIILDFEPASKPKVVLPPITNGAANASAFQKLQERLKKVEVEVKSLKEDGTQYEYVPQLRRDSQMQNLSTNVDTKLAELKGALQKQIFEDLSADQAADLLEHPMITAKVDEKISAARAEERGKLEAQVQGRVEKAKKLLSEVEIRELLESNWFAQSLMITKLHKRLEEEKTKMEAQVQERIEAAKTQLSEAEIRSILTSNSTAISIFKGNLKKRLEVEKSKITTALKAEFEEKLSAMEVAANTKRPSAVIPNVEKPIVSPALAASGFPASPNEQLSFGAGISRLTTPFSFPIAPLATSRSSSASVIFGETWKPRTPLGVLPSSPIGNSQSNNDVNIKPANPSLGKRSRDTEDVGERPAGSKKLCSEN